MHPTRAFRGKFPKIKSLKIAMLLLKQSFTKPKHPIFTFEQTNKIISLFMSCLYLKVILIYLKEKTIYFVIRWGIFHLISDKFSPC